MSDLQHELAKYLSRRRAAAAAAADGKEQGMKGRDDRTVERTEPHADRMAWKVASLIVARAREEQGS